MRCFVMFVTAVCELFLLKLKWPKNKSFYDLGMHIFWNRPFDWFLSSYTRYFSARREKLVWMREMEIIRKRETHA